MKLFSEKEKKERNHGNGSFQLTKLISNVCYITSKYFRLRANISVKVIPSVFVSFLLFSYHAFDFLRVSFFLYTRSFFLAKFSLRYLFLSTCSLFFRVIILFIIFLVSRSCREIREKQSGL